MAARFLKGSQQHQVPKGWVLCVQQRAPSVQLEVAGAVCAAGGGGGRVLCAAGGSGCHVSTVLLPQVVQGHQRPVLQCQSQVCVGSTHF